MSSGQNFELPAYTRQELSTNQEIASAQVEQFVEDTIKQITQFPFTKVPKEIQDNEQEKEKRLQKISEKRGQLKEVGESLTRNAEQFLYEVIVTASKIEAEQDSHNTKESMTIHKIQATVGAPGAGKGTNKQAVELAKEAVDPSEGNPEENINIEDPTIRSLLGFLNEQVTMSTGSYGIFGTKAPNHYKVYDALRHGITTIGNGELVDDSFTHGLVLLELARQIIAGNKTIDIDTYPRSIGQGELFANTIERLNHKFTTDGLNIQIQQELTHMELIEPGNEILLQKHKNEAIQVAQQAAEVIKNLKENASDRLISLKGEELTNYLQGFFTTELNPETMFVPKTVITTVTNIAKNIILRAHSRYLKAEENELGSGRPDDDDSISLANRVIAYFEQTFPFAITHATSIIPALPEIDEVVETYIIDILRSQEITKETNLENLSPEVQQFIEIAQQKALAKVQES